VDKDYDIRDQVKIANKRGARAIALGAAPQIAVSNNRLSNMKVEELTKLKEAQSETARSLRHSFDLFFDLNEHDVALLKASILDGVKNCVIGLQMFYMANAMVEAMNRANASLALTQLEINKRARKK
jgi:hypothetical protein